MNNPQRMGQWFYNKLFEVIDYRKPANEDELNKIVCAQRRRITDKLWNLSNKEFISLLLEYYNE